MVATSLKKHGLKFPAIQALRAIAAGLVVIHHLGWQAVYSGQTSAALISSGFSTLGQCGVDIFFVISGFIMTMSSGDSVGIHEGIQFLRKRVVRIFPIYWFYTSVLLVMWISGLALKHHIYQLKYLAGSYLLWPVSNGEDYHPLLNQGWTLSFEIYFYLIYAFGIAIGFKSGRFILLSIMFGVCSWVGHFHPQMGGLSYLVTNTIVAEFLLGILVANFARRMLALEYTDRIRTGAAVLLVLIGAGGLLFGVGRPDEYVSAFRPVYLGIPSAFIVFGAALLPAVWTNRYLVSAGDASYTTYLSHTFFTLLYGNMERRYPNTVPWGSDGILLSASVMIIAITYGLYRLIELPILNVLLTRRSSSGVIRA